MKTYTKSEIRQQLKRRFKRFNSYLANLEHTAKTELAKLESINDQSGFKSELTDMWRGELIALDLVKMRLEREFGI